MLNLTMETALTTEIFYVYLGTGASTFLVNANESPYTTEPYFIPGNYSIKGKIYEGHSISAGNIFFFRFIYMFQLKNTLF